jgi:hypothetical protein
MKVLPLTDFICGNKTVVILCCFYSTVCVNMIVIQDPPDMKFITRTVKVSNFMLKIIIKLCDQYSGYLGACHHELFEMLLTVYRYVMNGS